MVVASAGATNSGAIDELGAIADACAQTGCWLHVDAAYGGAALCVPEQAHRFEGIERADSFIASTDGDNTNIVIAQIAKRRFNVPTVIARILDPLRAEWYEKQGVNTICPTRVAIDMLEAQIREAAGNGGTPGGETADAS